MRWDRLPGAEACIGTRELALAVEARLGRAVFVSPALAEVSIDGRIQPAPAGALGFRAHLTLSDARGVVLGTRDLEGAQASLDGGCRALDEQLALVIALQFWVAQPGGGLIMAEDYESLGASTFTWDTTGLGAGVYTLEVRARTRHTTSASEVVQDITYTLL